MNLHEFVKQIMSIEQDLLQQGIEVNTVEVVKYSYTLDDSYIEADTISIDDITFFENIALNKKLILLD